MATCRRQYLLKITMLSDWHAGSGHGQPAGADALVARDPDRLPFVPAKTVHGLWRDACELVARGLDNGAYGPWSRLVEYLFGSEPARSRSVPRHPPRPAALCVRPARYPCQLRAVLSHNDTARRALTFLKPGVAITRKTGQAKEDFLRFEEVARVGSELEAECCLDVPESLLEPALALLVAGTKFFTRLGGKRRRGNGYCHVTLEGCNGSDVPAMERVCEIFQTVQPPVPEDDAEAPSAPTVLATTTQTAPTAWWLVPSVLRPHTPIAVTRRVVGNVVEALDYVPGYCLLPHVTNVLETLGIRDVFAHVAAGRVRVLNATLAIGGKRGRPVPFALHAAKRKGAHHFEDFDRVRNAFAQNIDTAAKPIRRGYLYWSDPDQVDFAITPMTIRTHGTVDDESQRPTTEVGGVYSYEAIAPAREDGSPVRLRSALVLPDDLHVKLQASDPNWWQKLSRSVVLGRSKKDDYGWVELTAEEPIAYNSADPAADGDVLSVWVASDVLIRNDRLRYDPTERVFRSLLAEALGVRLEPAPRESWQFVRVRRHETWHAGWGLPRPSLIAIQAGSCFLYRIVDGQLDPRRIAAVQARGVGERTAEGFGEVMLNHPVLRTQPSGWKRVSRTAATAVRSPRLLRDGEPGYRFARIIEREAWKQAIERRARELAADPQVRRKALGWSVEGDQVTPTLTQIMAFRQVVGRMRGSDDTDRVLGWINHVRAKRAKGEGEQGGYAMALRKYETLCQNKQAIWDLLFEGEPPTRLTEDGETQLKEELWAYALQAFVDACARAIRREVG